MSVNPVDLVLLLLLVIGFIWGFRRGFIYMIFSLLSIIGGVFAAGKLSPLIAPHLFSEQYMQVGYIVVFIVIFTLIYFIIRKLSYLVEDAIEFMELEWLDSLGGGVIGLAQFLIIVGIVVNLGYTSGLLYLIPSSEGSNIAPLMSTTSRAVIDFIAGNMGEIKKHIKL